MLERRETGKEGDWKGGRLERSETEKEGDMKGGILIGERQERRDAGKERVRNQGMMER